jgi:hypothetical protein
MTLAAVVASVTLVGAAVAKPGKGNGNGGSNNGGNRQATVRSMQSGPSGNKFAQVQKFQQFNGHRLDVVRNSRIVVNQSRQGQSFHLSHCPSKFKQHSFGFCFHGKACGHWQHKCWVPTYGCYFYYCPYTLVEYWYCVEDDCYYPVGYCPIAYRVKYKFAW